MDLLPACLIFFFFFMSLICQTLCTNPCILSLNSLSQKVRHGGLEGANQKESSRFRNKTHKHSTFGVGCGKCTGASTQSLHALTLLSFAPHKQEETHRGKKKKKKKKKGDKLGPNPAAAIHHFLN